MTAELVTSALLAKPAGDLKEHHDARLATAVPPIFDVATYVEEFGA